MTSMAPAQPQRPFPPGCLAFAHSQTWTFQRGGKTDPWHKGAGGLPHSSPASWDEGDPLLLPLTDSLGGFPCSPVFQSWKCVAPAEIPVCTGWINPKETAYKSFSPVLPKDHDSVLLFWVEINWFGPITII